MGRAVTCTTKWTGPCPMWGEFHHCAHASLIHDGDHGCECGANVDRGRALHELWTEEILEDLAKRYPFGPPSAWAAR